MHLVKFLAALILTAALVAPPLAAQGKVLTHKQAGVKIDLPDKWSAKDEGDDGTLVVDAPDGELAVTFSVVEADQLETVLQETLTALEEELGEIEADDAEDIKINGMEGFGLDGVTKKDGIHVSLLCLITPKNKCLTIFYFASEAAAKKYDKEITRIVKGIKKL